MTETQTNSPVRKLVAELTRDKKKAAVLGVLVLVGAVFTIKALVHGGGPAAASATPLAAKDSLTCGPKFQEDPADRDLKVKARRDQYIQQMDGSITRDIFLANLDLFPRKNVEPVKVVLTPTTAASGPAPIPEEQDRKVIQAEAQALVLQSTMVGASSIANINGKILRVGEWFSGFEIMEITSHSCLVRKRNVTAVLEIKQ
jgi:hypothetical protein